MRIAVTGASGFIGGAVVDRTLAEGHEVFAYSRRPMTPRRGMQWQRWDLADGCLPDPPQVDAVIHAAAHVDDWSPWAVHEQVTLAGTRAVLDTWPRARVVLVSSCSVYPLHARDQLFPETVPVTSRSLSDYARAKIAQEQLVASGSGHLILRPHAVHGPGDTTLLPRLRRARRRGRLLCPGSPDTLVHLTDVHLLAAAAVAGAGRRDVSGILNVTDATPIRLDVLAPAVARANDWPEAPVYLPSPVARGAANLLERVARGLRQDHPPLLTRYGVSHLAVSRTFPHDRLVATLGIRPGPTDVSEWTDRLD